MRFSNGDGGGGGGRKAAADVGQQQHTGAEREQKYLPER